MPLTFANIMDGNHLIREEIGRVLWDDFLLVNVTLVFNISGKQWSSPKRNGRAIARLECRVQSVEDEERNELTVSLFIYPDFFVYYSGDEELIERLKKPLAEYRHTFRMMYDNEYKAAEFMKQSKEELMAAAWHPSRVEKWIEAGYEIVE